MAADSRRAPVEQSLRRLFTGEGWASPLPVRAQNHGGHSESPVAVQVRSAVLKAAAGPGFGVSHSQEWKAVLHCGGVQELHSTISDLKRLVGEQERHIQQLKRQQDASTLLEREVDYLMQARHALLQQKAQLEKENQILWVERYVMGQQLGVDLRDDESSSLCTALAAEVQAAQEGKEAAHMLQHLQMQLSQHESMASTSPQEPSWARCSSQPTSCVQRAVSSENLLRQLHSGSSFGLGAGLLLPTNLSDVAHSWCGTPGGPDKGLLPHMSPKHTRQRHDNTSTNDVLQPAVLVGNLLLDDAVEAAAVHSLNGRCSQDTQPLSWSSTDADAVEGLERLSMDSAHATGTAMHAKHNSLGDPPAAITGASLGGSTSISTGEKAWPVGQLPGDESSDDACDVLLQAKDRSAHVTFKSPRLVAAAQMDAHNLT